MALRSALLLALAGVAKSNLVTLNELIEAIKTGPNRKVAFLSPANYDAVHTVLPANVEPVYCDNSTKSGVGVGCDSTDELIGLITSGEVIAGLISGLPTANHAPKLHTFSSTMVSPRAMFMAPSASTEMPHGSSDTAKSSFDLSKAVDAAIVKLQHEGKDELIRQRNMPFEFMAVHTCKGSDLSAFTVPNVAEATGLLRMVLDTKTLKIGALGPYDWGGNDGNYRVTPYTGFYPDWLTEFCQQFNKLKGPNGVAYNAAGTITCERVWQLGSAGVFADLFDGKSHVTEPYYTVDAFYDGTKEDCSSSAAVCRASAAGKETCKESSKTNTDGTIVTEKKCTHPRSPRTRHFRMSCTTVGVDSTFMTHKKVASANAAASDDDEDNSTVLIIAIVIAGVFALLAVCVGSFTCVIIKREKKGTPMFTPLQDAKQSPGDATSYGNQQ